MSLMVMEVYRGARAGPVSTNSLSPLFHPILQEGSGRKGRDLPKKRWLAAETPTLVLLIPHLQHIAFSMVPKPRGDKVSPTHE